VIRTKKMTGASVSREDGIAKSAKKVTTRSKTTTPKTTRTKKTIKKSSRETQDALNLEPKPLTAEIMERWHRDLARITGRISLTLARRRLPRDLADDVALTLSVLLEEARLHQ